MQMEDELRLSEQAERQNEIAAIEAAAPVAPPIEPETRRRPSQPPKPLPRTPSAAPTDSALKRPKPDRQTTEALRLRHRENST